MKTKTKLTSVLASAALILPAAAFANSSSGSSAGTKASGASTYSGSTVGHFQQINKEELKNRVTADDLVGKSVVDRDGKKIGEVKDVGLTQVIGTNKSGMDAKHYGATGSVGGISAGASVSTQTGRPSAAGSPASPSTIAGDDAVNSTSNRSATMSSGTVNLLVELDGDVRQNQDNDKDFAVIPASQVTFDHEEDRLRLSMARQELAANLRQ